MCKFSREIKHAEDTKYNPPQYHTPLKEADFKNCFNRVYMTPGIKGIQSDE